MMIVPVRRTIMLTMVSNSFYSSSSLPINNKLLFLQTPQPKQQSRNFFPRNYPTTLYFEQKKQFSTSDFADTIPIHPFHLCLLREERKRLKK